MQDALTLAQNMRYNLGSAVVAIGKAEEATPAQKKKLLDEAISFLEAELEAVAPEKPAKKRAPKKSKPKKTETKKPEPPIKNLDESEDDELPEDIDDIDV